MYLALSGHNCVAAIRPLLLQHTTFRPHCGACDRHHSSAARHSHPPEVFPQRQQAAIRQATLILPSLCFPGRKNYFVAGCSAVPSMGGNPLNDTRHAGPMRRVTAPCGWRFSPVVLQLRRYVMSSRESSVKHVAKEVGKDLAKEALYQQSCHQGQSSVCQQWAGYSEVLNNASCRTPWLGL